MSPRVCSMEGSDPVNIAWFKNEGRRLLGILSRPIIKYYRFQPSKSHRDDLQISFL